MRGKGFGRWEVLWIVASVAWIAGVGLFALKQHQLAADRLRFWADSVEWIINADPMVPISAKELRGQLGDEKFITEAPKAYPKVNLQEIVRRYEADRAAHASSYASPGVPFVLAALLPPVLAYGVLAAVRFIGASRARRRSALPSHR
jgi:hypothetical protein